MCTASWLLTETGYQLFFNRDEQKSRVKALPAQMHQKQSVCYPIDPQGGGTWIGVNTSGMSLCLLNNYQTKLAHLLPATSLTSRGVIIPELFKSYAQGESSSIFALLDALVKKSLFAPFSLLYFPAGLCKQQGRVYQYNWDGKTLNVVTAIAPVISSGVDFECVQQNRKNVYQQFIAQTDYPIEQRHLLFHASHVPEQSEYSVCMHRADAQTVSFTQVKVAPDEISLSYYDKPLCQASSPLNLYLTGSG